MKFKWYLCTQLTTTQILTVTLAAFLLWSAVTVQYSGWWVYRKFALVHVHNNVIESTVEKRNSRITTETNTNTNPNTKWLTRILTLISTRLHFFFSGSNKSMEQFVTRCWRFVTELFQESLREKKELWDGLLQRQIVYKSYRLHEINKMFGSIKKKRMSMAGEAAPGKQQEVINIAVMDRCKFPIDTGCLFDERMNRWPAKRYSLSYTKPTYKNSHIE